MDSELFLMNLEIVRTYTFMWTSTGVEFHPVVYKNCYRCSSVFIFVVAELQFCVQKYGFNTSDPALQRALSAYAGLPSDAGSIEDDVSLS
jgi:hypothetical protein